MKLELVATPEELKEKGDKLIKSLSDLFQPVSPELAEYLEKALPQKETELKYPVLRELHKRTKEAYEKQLKLMVKDIEGVLDRGLKKSEDFTKPIADKDEVAYNKVKIELAKYGYGAEAFEEGGVLYGWSTNELIDLARAKREQEKEGK